MNSNQTPSQFNRSKRGIALLQQGLTLVELLVSIVLMSLVTLATVSLYGVINSSYKTVDAGQQMNDNARYAFETIGQALRIAGYQEYLPSGTDASAPGGRIYPANCLGSSPPCPIIGFNNSKVTSVTNVDSFGATNNGGVNLSDTLGVTYSGSSLANDPLQPDGSVIDCQGVAQPSSQSTTDLGVSLFWVTTTNNEPELACVSRGSVTAPGGPVRNSQTVIRGVETFQVMYGVDTNGDSLPNRWVSAQNVTNWMAVRAVRVGFVLRGPPGSSQGTAVTAADNILYPLGQEFVGTSPETGLSFTPPADGRLRRAYATTFMLRNSF
ncbi:MAG: PilW family protein [Ramlibacter sp.]|nr:PilW family protein [Ramlibacter sp.]